MGAVRLEISHTDQDHHPPVINLVIIVRELVGARNVLLLNAYTDLLMVEIGLLCTMNQEMAR